MRKIRVLVVEDSSVMRRAIMVALTKDASLEIVGAARHGEEALALLAELKPDVITLDIEMPVMDGLATLRALRKQRSEVPVIMFSSLTQRGAQATVLALTIGATDCVGKPANMDNVTESWKSLEDELLPKVKLYGENYILRHERAAPTPPRPTAASSSTPAAPSVARASSLPPPPVRSRWICRALKFPLRPWRPLKARRKQPRRRRRSLPPAPSARWSRPSNLILRPA